MRLTQAACPNVVALLGTTISDVQLTWLAQAPALLVLLDGDQSGRKCSRAIANAIAHLTTVHIHELGYQQEPEDLTDADLLTLVGTYLPFSLNQPLVLCGGKELL